ncbi:MAG: hypothetical protein AAGD14_09820 [Planctomycetota bacterium]
MKHLALFLLLGACASTTPPAATKASLTPPAAVANEEGAFLLTVFLKHDQAKTLDEIKAHLAETGFWAKFPPDGIEVESWYVMMGVGQVVTIRVPPSRLREVNVILEKAAWGAFRTDFYPTYDLRPVAQELRAKARMKK